MIRISLGLDGKFYVTTIAKGNGQKLQHSEGINTAASVRKHIAAMLKAYNSKAIKVIDTTGKFKEYA